MTGKLRAGILGVSGAAGQQFVKEITDSDHPQFEISKAYGLSSVGEEIVIAPGNDSSKWHTEKIATPSLAHVDELDLIFSALPTEPAKELEAMFAQHLPVISVSSAYRYEHDVPILIPEVNEQHAELIQWQQIHRGWKGFIVPGPNCTVVPAAITLAALREFGIKKVFYTSYQAVSGAGRDALDELVKQEDQIASGFKDKIYVRNVIPYINGEEEKVRTELNKILGEFSDHLSPSQIRVDGTCARVPVHYGHTLVLNIETKKEIDEGKALDAFEDFNRSCKELFGDLYSSPQKTITIMQEEDRPQPYHDANLDGGMTTCVGRIRKSKLFERGLQYVALSNNLKKGAAKGAVQTAEFLLREGYIERRS